MDSSVAAPLPNKTVGRCDGWRQMHVGMTYADIYWLSYGLWTIGNCGILHMTALSAPCFLLRPLFFIAPLVFYCTPCNFIFVTPGCFTVVVIYTVLSVCYVYWNLGLFGCECSIMMYSLFFLDNVVFCPTFVINKGFCIFLFCLLFIFVMGYYTPEAHYYGPFDSLRALSFSLCGLCLALEPHVHYYVVSG